MATDDYDPVADALDALDHMNPELLPAGDGIRVDAAGGHYVTAVCRDAGWDVTLYRAGDGEITRRTVLGEVLVETVAQLIA